MRILYDHQAFSGKQFGGVARYFYDLMVSLRKMGVETKLSAKFSNNAYLAEDDNFKIQSFDFFMGHMPTNMFFSHVNRANSAAKLLTKNYDVFHPTFYNPYFLNFIGKKPFVLTYHDLIKEKLEFDYLDTVGKEKKQFLLDKASAVIAVSENTKNDLIECFDIKPEKISVVYHGSQFNTFIPLPVSFAKPLPKDYLLYVGMRNDYKNFIPYLMAIAPILHKYPDLHFICGGGGDFDAHEKQVINDLKLNDKVIYQPIDDNILHHLYANAIAFVYPSLYEGFGIPILEAYACNCPVLLSKTSCFPEVAQDAALYFEPTNMDSIQHELERLILSDSLRQTLIEKGKKRQEFFSLEKTAQQTLQVYQSIL